MLIEYHLFQTRPLEKCFSDSENAQVSGGAREVFHVVEGLRARIAKENGKTKKQVQGYAFIDKVPAVLIRSDGSVHLLERYNRFGEEILEMMRDSGEFPNE